MSRFIDLTGQRFGRLTALSLAEGSASDKSRLWLCKCDCGKETIVSSNNLKRGNTKSCGCLRAERRIEVHTKHGQARKDCLTKSFSCWCAIRSRCYNSNAKEYKYYGGRGISVCDRWLESFENFYEDMGDAPEDRSIDRIDNDGNYEPGNCRWATTKEQSNNRRKDRIFLVVNSNKMCISDASRLYSIRIGKLRWRLFEGWSPACSLFLPSSRKDSPATKRNIANFAKNYGIDREIDNNLAAVK